MTVDVVIDQNEYASSIAPDLLCSILEEVAALEGRFPRGDWSLTVRLTSDEELSLLHERYFGDPTPTDVITFPFDDPRDGSGHLGDIVISVDMAETHARSAGHSVAREIAFLGVHGLLHLCGYEDDSSCQRQDMLARQEMLLEKSERALGVRL
jgi:probable rRNA maturation factor